MISTIQFNTLDKFTPNEAAYILSLNIEKYSVKQIEKEWNDLVLTELAEYNKWKKTFTGWDIYRYDIINYLIKKFKYQNYLEIGVRDSECFAKINIAHKDAVDPDPVKDGKKITNYVITSDEFFNLIKGHDIKYDIIFIDGLHYDYQVYKDICNALNHLTPNGTIICHDMNPLYFVTAGKRGIADIPQWNGDCWKAWAKLRTENPNITMEVINTDHGIGVIRHGKQQLFKVKDNSLLNTYDGSATWKLLDKHRKELLNLISIKEFFKKYD